LMDSTVLDETGENIRDRQKVFFPRREHSAQSL
jgi:hypothetical protein